jgi:hypothetical protein
MHFFNKNQTENKENAMEFINLLGFQIEVYNMEDGTSTVFPPSPRILRIDEPLAPKKIEGVEVAICVAPRCIVFGLPLLNWGTILIVPDRVRRMFPWRSDLASIGKEIPGGHNKRYETLILNNPDDDLADDVKALIGFVQCQIETAPDQVKNAMLRLQDDYTTITRVCLK